MHPKFPNINDFPVLRELVSQFPKAQICLVGGAVRDILIGKKTTDFDMLLRGVNPDELETFLASRGRVVYAGKNFGVWKFCEIGRPKNEMYDIAMPRTEFSLHKQGMYKDFSVKTDPHLPIEEDLKRRDFTINAMAYDLVTRKLIDPHQGSADVLSKIIRTVGKPEDRFAEDYSRLLRALRFSIQLGFNIEPETMASLTSLMVNINDEIDGRNTVPRETIAEEFLKSLRADALAAIKIWDSAGALAEIIPELLHMKNCPQPDAWHTEGDVWNHTLLALEKLKSEELKNEFNNEPIDSDLMLAVLFHDIGKPYTIQIPERNDVERIRYNDHDNVGARITEKILNRLKISAPPEAGVSVENIVWMIENHMLLVHGDPEKLRPNTIEKYFFNPRKPSRNLMKLMLADGLATIGPDGAGFREKFDQLCRRIAEIKKTTGSRGHLLAKPLINGNAVMKITGIEPGIGVGKIIEDIRHKQLSGELKSKEDAISYLKNTKNQSQNR